MRHLNKKTVPMQNAKIKVAYQKVMEITSFLTDEKKSTQQHRI
jgi:hypothetical protein